MYASVAGVPFKMGGYGLIRTWNCYLMLILDFFLLWLVMIGAVQIVYAAPTSLGQQNRKRRIVFTISYGIFNYWFHGRYRSQWIHFQMIFH